MNPEENLSPNFKLKEFLKNGSLEGVTPEIYANLKKLANALENVRKLCGNKSIHINSGFRTKAHNKAVGGEPGSRHMYGQAADIVVTGLTARQVQGILAGWDGGLGRYPNFTHVDVWKKREWSRP